MSKPRKMTLFQARFIQWLTLVGCSIRATAKHFWHRYNGDFTQTGIPYDPKGSEHNSQLDGMYLRECAIEVLNNYGIEPIISIYGNNIGYENDSYKEWRLKTKRQ